MHREAAHLEQRLSHRRSPAPGARLRRTRRNGCTRSRGRRPIGLQREIAARAVGAARWHSADGSGSPGAARRGRAACPGSTRACSRTHVEVGHRAQQAERVRVSRLAEDLVDRARLDDLARVHHRDALARLGDTARSCETKTTLTPSSLAQRGEQLQDLVLDRHVERGGRLVAEDQLRLQAESAIAIITRWRMPPESSCG